MNALVACEESQTVTIALREKGIEAYSCDTELCSGGFPEWHIQDDALKVLTSRSWDLVIAHPPCTYLSKSGVKHLVRKSSTPGFKFHKESGMYVNWQRYNLMEIAADFFKQFMLYGKLGGRIAIENPIMHKYAVELIGRKQDQVVQPWMFGHMEQKATCLWLYNLPELQETNNVKSEMMNLPYSQRAKVHYASPGPERKKLRSKTYPGIARAMAEQWTPETVINSTLEGGEG